MTDVHRLDDVVFVGLVLENLGGSWLELVDEVVWFWSLAELWDDRSLENSLIWLDDDQVQTVSGGVVSVHTGFQGTLYQLLSLFLLKTQD